MRIIKFDHISYVAENKDKENILKSFAGRKLKFSETGVENQNSKKLLMRRKDQKYHNLYFFEGGGMDIEVILYDNIGGKSKVELKTDAICAKCVDLERIANCFRKIGMPEGEWREQTLVYNFKGLLGKQDIYLEIREQDKSQEIYLDDEGYGCVALLVDSLSGLEKISDSQNMITEVERMRINQRLLDICFWKNTELNIIFEFITAGKGSYGFY